MPDYVIFVVAKGQVESSMNIIEDLYYGRIAPYEVSMTATPEFEKLTESVTDISSVSEREMFITGFRLGVKLMIDVMK